MWPYSPLMVPLSVLANLKHRMQSKKLGCWSQKKKTCLFKPPFLSVNIFSCLVRFICICECEKYPYFMLITSFAPQEFLCWLLSVWRTVFTGKSDTRSSTVRTAMYFSFQQELKDFIKFWKNKYEQMPPVVSQLTFWEA